MAAWSSHCPKSASTNRNLAPLAGIAKAASNAVVVVIDVVVEEEEVLDDVKPHVLHVHLAQTFCQPSERLITLVNEKQYLIDVKGNMWTIWTR